MWHKPPFLLLICFAFITFLVFYRLYRIWFRTDDEYSYWVERKNKMPSWYPFKEFSTIAIKDKEKWISLSKTSTTIGAIAIVGMNALIITAFFLGK